MTLEKFIQTLSEIANVPIERMEENTSFRDDLGVDSLQMVNLIVTLNVNIEALEGPDDLRTVGKLYCVWKKGR